MAVLILTGMSEQGKTAGIFPGSFSREKQSGEGRHGLKTSTSEPEPNRAAAAVLQPEGRFGQVQSGFPLHKSGFDNGTCQ